MVYEGHGFAIIRGLDVDQFSSEDLVIVTLGLTSYIASKRGMQDQRGSMLSMPSLTRLLLIDFLF